MTTNNPGISSLHDDAGRPASAGGASAFGVGGLSAEALVAALRAGGEPSRLRILTLLEAGDLTVKDLTTVLAQSQPRISRHLKLLTEAGLVDRFPEGAWVYYRLAETGALGAMARGLVAALDPTDETAARDRERLAAVKRGHAERTAAYFAEHAGDWERLRSLHVEEARVEEAIREALGERPFGALLDVGTGTGRLLTLLADRYDRAVGVDASHDMLTAARSELDRAGLSRARVQQGDLHALGLPRDAFDVVTIHQVLHYLDDPGSAIREAARTLRPGGRLLVVDFAPHDLEFLRESHAHRRLGFAHGEIARWLEQAGLDLVETRDLPPSPQIGGDGALTVTLWLGRDPRLLLASGTPTKATT
ncbi:MAG: metalloregulator ArsR/SmtB family transcription factor [Hyphomicrobiales bacterium]|nr:metalloregulator ArsR/SmtB family transcription factor [Hyphomicrobiales bacterium]